MLLVFSTQELQAQKASKMKDATIMEITTFKVNENVTDEVMLAAAEKMQREFLNWVEGYITRTITKGEDGIWRDVIYWADKHFLETAAAELGKSAAAAPFMNCINFESVNMTALEIKAHY